jgi:fructuronate reductase
MALTLGRATLSRVPEECRPLVVPGDVGPGIVHLGVGAFHRAHQAVYTEAAIAAAMTPTPTSVDHGRGSVDWGIVGVAPRRRELIDTLAGQDGLFSVTSVDGGGSSTRIVGALADVRHAPSRPSAIVAELADPAIKIVTLTVTEKAYLLDPATGRLRVDDSLRAELTGAAEPSSIPGLLVAGLRARERADAGPIALVSCDNLPSNGRRLCGAVTQSFQAAGLPADWLEANVTFPGTMVDRIVPATTPAVLSAAAAALGVADGAAVSAEPFSEWVIEDDFPAGRPAWELAGAVLTDDAGPYERLKLRALNGVHSALAYLGALAGCETIADALALPGMRAALERFVVDDIAPSLDPPGGVSVAEYGGQVLERFANPATGHRTLQVAMDGSQKLPQRILHTAVDRRAAGASPRWAALPVAAWMRFVAGRADDGRDLPLDDPLAAEIRAALDGANGKVDALLGLDQIFPAELAADEVWRGLVDGWLIELDKHGVADLLAAVK